MYLHISRRAFQGLSLLAVMATLTACSSLHFQRGEIEAVPEAPVMPGSSSRNNTTPMESAFSCMANSYQMAKVPVVSITVGDVKDYTGKYSQAEGNAITQGGSLMLYSALGKLGRAVRLQERFDTRIAELELAYADRRQLGDGKLHAVEAGKPQVPWVPYFGGTILRSDYYIVGGITEVNYNIKSGGAEFNVSSIGAKVRTFTMNVGVDLRIVDSRSLLVVKTISMQKQITGTEVGAGIFRFFGTELLDVNMGSKNQEPLQLGVRTTIEHGVLELLGAVSGLSPQPCVDFALKGQPSANSLQAAIEETVQAVLQATNAQAAPVQQGVEAVSPAATQAMPVPVNAVKATAQKDPQGLSSIAFEINQSQLDASTLRGLAQMAAELASNELKTQQFELLTRDTENLPTAQRRQMAQERVKAVSDTLLTAGLPSSRISVEWLPDSAAMQRQSAGMQVVARMNVSASKAGKGQ